LARPLLARFLFSKDFDKYRLNIYNIR
jgi:hypothetical protein